MLIVVLNLFSLQEIKHSMLKKDSLMNLRDAKLVEKQKKQIEDTFTVIPSSVTFSFESRHQDPNVIEKVEQIIFDLPKEMENCQLSYTKLWSRDTVYFAPEVIHAVEASTAELGYSRYHMSSAYSNWQGKTSLPSRSMKPYFSVVLSQMRARPSWKS